MCQKYPAQIFEERYAKNIQKHLKQNSGKSAFCHDFEGKQDFYGKKKPSDLGSLRQNPASVLPQPVPLLPLLVLPVPALRPWAPAPAPWASALA